MDVQSRLYVYNGLNGEKEEIISMHKDEVTQFSKEVDREISARVSTLVDIDKNNYDADDEDDSDSGNEDEVSGSGCGQEALIRMKRINASNCVKPNFLNSDVCVTQSYIIVTSTGGGMYSVCHYCYYLCALEIPNGKHIHVNTHYKRSIYCCEEDLICKVCEQNLFQVISEKVCVKCNKPEEQKIDNHRIKKSILQQCS